MAASSYTEIGIARIDVQPIKNPKEFVRNYTRYFCVRKVRGDFEDRGDVLVCRVETPLVDYEKKHAPKLLQFGLDLHSMLSNYGGPEGRKLLERIDIENRYITDEVTWEMQVRF